VPAAAPTASLRAETATPAPTESPTPITTPTATSGPTAVPSRTPKPLQVLWRGDLHVHTTSSDGDNTYEEMLERALELDFDFLAITDHYGVSVADNAEASTKCRAETRLFCIPGEELFAGPEPLHLLALGVSEATDATLTLQEQVEEIHRQGGLAIAAHPARPGYSMEDLYFSGFDAMECARGSEAYNLEQLQLSAQYNLPCAYNSDAHAREELGSRYTVCSVPINSLVDLKVAWLLGQCEMNR
jgi:predicted metal-dependent phosphoesterase TrpH